MSKRPIEPLPHPKADAKGAAPSGARHPAKIEGTDLGEAELAVLRVLWEIAPATVRDVMNQLHARAGGGKKVAYTTVLTFLSRLEQKGVVVSDKKDQAYVYRPRVSRESVSQSRVLALLDQLYDGAAGPMVLQLVEQAKLTSDELAKLRQLIDELDGQPAGTPLASTGPSQRREQRADLASDGRSSSSRGNGGSRVHAG